MDSLCWPWVDANVDECFNATFRSYNQKNAKKNLRSVLSLDTDATGRAVGCPVGCPLRSFARKWKPCNHNINLKNSELDLCTSLKLTYLLSP